MKRTAFMLLCLLIVLFLSTDSLGAESSYGQEAETSEANLDLDQYDLTDIQNFLDQAKGEQGMKLSFQELMKDLMAGNLNQVMGQAGKAMKDLLMGEIKNSGHMMGQIMVLGIIGAVFSFPACLQEARYRKPDFLSPICCCSLIWQPAFLPALPLQGMCLGRSLILPGY